MKVLNFVGGVFILSLVLFLGCNEQVNEPTQFQSTDLELYKFETVESDLSLLKSCGMPLIEGDGVFSIGWNEVFRPFDDDFRIKGMAFAVVFGDQSTNSDRFPGYGLDLGTVTINYANTEINMYKMQHDARGTAYSLFHRPFGGSDNLLEYIPNTDYQFVVSGSDSFSPLTVTLTSPSSLINISNLNHGDDINVNEDLTVTWDGGNADGQIAIRIMAHRDPFKKDGPPDGRGGRRGHHQPPPPALNEGDVIIEILDNNPGEYSIPAATIQRLIGDSGVDKLVVGVSQLDMSVIEHDGKSINTAMRNGNSVMLNIVQ
ncbi:MAG: hypothetical protein P8X73_03415 [Ignavibacteriaceae bacterium]|jgi:hypothetical protein